jgi:hypothetical protein
MKQYKPWSRQEVKALQEAMKEHGHLTVSALTHKLVPILKRKYSSIESKIYKVKQGNVTFQLDTVPEVDMEHQLNMQELNELADAYIPINYTPLPKEEINVSIPLAALTSSKHEPAAITLVMSDLHLGDSNHLPETYWSCVANADQIIKYLAGKFDIKRFAIHLNGDIVAGRDIYRKQVFRNLIQRGHWQVSLAAAVIRETTEKFRTLVDEIHLVKGTHEPIEENYAIYLQKELNTITKSYYHGRMGIVNVAEPVGKHNVLFTHGKGSSDYSPVSPSMTRELWNLWTQVPVRVERACVSHTHNLTVGLHKQGIDIDVTGGFQMYEPVLTHRPCGMILYLYTMGELSVMKVKPDIQIERDECDAGTLEWTNLTYYSDKLRRYAARGYM